MICVIWCVSSERAIKCGEQYFLHCVFVSVCVCKLQNGGDYEDNDLMV